LSIDLRNLISRAKLHRFLSPMYRPLTPANSHLHYAQGVRLAGRSGGTHVLARPLVHFRYIRFPELPRHDRLGHVRVQLLAWAPFQESEFALIMGECGAAVFAWDRADFVQRCEQAEIDDRPARMILESLLHPAHQEGISLRRCVHGFEGMVWHDGELVADRWWAQAPDAEAWLNFQRSAGVPPQAQEIELPGIAAEARWLAAPWAEPKMLSDLLGRNRLYEHAALAVALLVMLLPTLWLLKSLFVLDAHTAALDEEKLRLETAARPVLEARSGALDALTTLGAIVKRVDRPDPLVLLAHLSRQLPDDGTVLREFEWEGERVRLVLLPPPAASRIAYVEALEGGGWLRNVRESTSNRSGQGVVLVADLVGGPPAPDRN
jgi:hypothetical protein